MEECRPHILYLDDHPLMRAVLGNILAQRGILHGFADPRDAIAFLSCHPVDMVITDVSMPHLPVDGKWFIAEVRKLDPHVEIVVTMTDEVLCRPEMARYPHLRLLMKSDVEYSSKLQLAVSAALAGTRSRRNAA